MQAGAMKMLTMNTVVNGNDSAAATEAPRRHDNLPPVFDNLTNARAGGSPQTWRMNVIGNGMMQLPGVGIARRVEPRRKEGAPRRNAGRRHWPRLRVVAGQFVVCIEK